MELLWEYDQMRIMRMSIEECADRLIPKGLTVGKCENDTKCSDLAICSDENAKEKTERIVDLMTSFYGVDAGCYGVEAYPLASHLIANGVTVQEWISVKDRLPEVETEVFILADRNGRKIRTTAMYEDGTVYTGNSDWHWEAYGFEYDEEKDDCLIPEGWWEYRHYNQDDAYNNPVDDVVTHWMPLPEPQKESENNEC